MNSRKFSRRLLPACMLISLAGTAQNPIIQTVFTADPAPLVYHDTVYLYTGHDEDDAKGFKMFNWMLYTSTDMVNWVDHGAVASLKDFSWTGDNGAWAPQCIERDGKFYFYAPMNRKGGGMAIGVAVSNSPYGPFTDAIGKPLISGNSKGDIDPAVFIDNDGQAYLYWGNPDCFYVKLNKDMISYSGDIVKIDSRPPNYQEGPWLTKRNDWYYLAYASTCCPEGMGYSMSKSPTGPWEYKGMIMDGDKRSSGNHPGIIDYKGSTYVFGFDYALLRKETQTHYERRSVCLEKITCNPDGTIQKLPFWSDAGVAQVGTLNPFIQNEAETIAWENGIETAKNSQVGVYVTDIDNGDYIKVRGLGFGKGAKAFEANIAAATAGGAIEIHLDSLTGPLAGTLPVKNTGGLQSWKTGSVKVKKAQGVHDVYFVFRGGNGPLFNFNWWKFSRK